MALDVVIAGAGIGGLALANGLRRSGVAVTVLERDAALASRRQGYRLHIDDNGGEALRRVLPPEQYARYRAISNDVSAPPRVVVRDTALAEVWSAVVGGPDPEHTAVDRLTLRRVLADGLDGILRYGCGITGAVADGAGVRVALADGSTLTADLLVAADGISSPFRPPGQRLHDTGARVVYGRLPLTARERAWLPPELLHGFTSVAGGDGSRMVIAALHPRDRALPSYVMWAVVAQAGDDAAFFAAAPHDLLARAAAHTGGWHPALRRMIAGSDPADVLPIAIRTCHEVPAPPPGPVTVLGDAIHPMSPAGGAGANTALRDAALLTDLLGDVDVGRTDLDTALSDYGRAMPVYAQAAVDASRRQEGTSTTMKGTR